MAYEPPDWLNADDRDREAALVEALRQIVTASRDVLDTCEGEKGLLGWRWRVEALTAEAHEMAFKMRKPLSAREHVSAGANREEQP